MTTETRATDVLSLLADAECRDILEATAATSMSVPELADRLGVPTSTAYLKVESLVKMGLLDEQVRIQPERRNPSEYRLRGGIVTVTMDEADQLVIDYQAGVGGRAEGETEEGIGQAREKLDDYRTERNTV